MVLCDDTVDVMDASEVRLYVSAADAGHYRVSSCGDYID